jgi:hypothetical protein
MEDHFGSMVLINAARRGDAFYWGFWRPVLVVILSSGENDINWGTCEREMIQHVVDSGCLVGKLRRPENAQGAEGTEGLAGYPLRARSGSSCGLGSRSGPTGCCASCGDSKSITRDAHPSNQEPRPGNWPGFFLARATAL